MSENVPFPYRGPPSPTKLSYKESVDAVTKLKCPECRDSFSGGDIISRPGCPGDCSSWYHLSCCETMASSKQPRSCSNCGGQLFLNSRTLLNRFEIALLPPPPLPSCTTSTPPSSPDSYAADSPLPTPPFETESPFYRQ